MAVSVVGVMGSLRQQVVGAAVHSQWPLPAGPRRPTICVQQTSRGTNAGVAAQGVQQQERVQLGRAEWEVWRVDWSARLEWGRINRGRAAAQPGSVRLLQLADGVHTRDWLVSRIPGQQE